MTISTTTAPLPSAAPGPSAGTLPRVRPLAITALGVISPAGVGLEALADALAGATAPCADPAQLPLGPSEPDGLPDNIRVVPDFRLADHVGRRKTRHLDRTTGLGLAACALLRAAAGPPPGGDAEPAWDSTGVVLGSTSGSVRSSSEFARDTHVHDRPYLVDAAAFPNTVMNSCTGQIAIWNGLHGINATLSGGTTATLAAFRYARNALDRGHADRLLVGGVEELCPQTAWGWAASGALAQGFPVGEGCALFAVQDAARAREDGAPVLAELLASETAFSPEGVRPGVSAVLADCVTRALERAGADPADVGAVSLGATGLVGFEEAERRAVRRALGGRTVTEIRVKEVTGEAYSADGAFQLAAVLARTAPGQLSLVTGIGQDGHVACLVVRTGEGA
ncbi:beta-ketoacyl synthase N-terminal-like domain-containing protein [Streptomyces liangshanensis]|uniref:beta-ketoacyl synthase N-terminal-like domain-containing protein n=1 Tax=Streptomyces liangshanensis TaxID=2717324 RepID=UPI0036DC147F